ncbi:MAG: type II secretion system F family protein [Cyanobacteria bacterium HKST-UBA04]|nr:type II secretion system F family protein [Cyanobacteria bacterium HKST-UBA05]MCA9798096.1 type II secretion system F family protein [Cyanobacteria bacterium HKST-UBA04]MCA9841786.1 type II secretion system F family protein [Cyanobacteria bacterium HKST-UBA03]
MELVYILPAISVLCMLAGVYFVLFHKREEARTFAANLLSEEKMDYKRRAQQQVILRKRRNENQTGFLAKIDMDMERANLFIKPNEFLMLMGGCATMAFLLVLAMGKGLLLAIPAGILGIFLPKLYIKFSIWRRMGKAEKELAQVLDTFASCFKSGYSFSRAVQQVAEQYDDPWGTELAKVSAEMNFGSSVEESLVGLTKRIPQSDVAMFVTAVLIQRETGGNLGELLETLSKTVRERFKLMNKVKALSAQGKLSAFIIFMIPFGLASIYSAMFPEVMMNFFHHPIGWGLMTLAGGCQLVGGFVLKNIVTLEV